MRWQMAVFPLPGAPWKKMARPEFIAGPRPSKMLSRTSRPSSFWVSICRVTRTPRMLCARTAATQAS